MNKNEEDKTDNQNGLKGKEIETEILGIKCIQANHSFTFRLPSEESKSYVIGAEHSSIGYPMPSFYSSTILKKKENKRSISRYNSFRRIENKKQGGKKCQITIPYRTW